jgi:hypothetical protein
MKSSIYNSINICEKIQIIGLHKFPGSSPKYGSPEIGLK